MLLPLTLRAWRDSSTGQATPWEERARSLLPSPPLALAGRGSLGLQGWLSLPGGLLAAAGGGARRSPSPTLRRWQLCADRGGARLGRARGGNSRGGAAAEPGWGAHGAALGLRGLSAVEEAAAAAASSLPPLPFGLFLFPLFLSLASSIARSPRLIPRRSSSSASQL